MAPISQISEPPENPGRFKLSIQGAIAAGESTREALNTGKYAVNPTDGSLVPVAGPGQYHEPEVDKAGGGFGKLGKWWKKTMPTWAGGGGGGGGQAPPPKGDIRERGLRAMDRLIKVHGWTPEGAAAAVGQAMQESSVRSDGPPGDHGTSFGMFQWHNERAVALRRYAAARGKNWQDFDTQIDFFNEDRSRRGALEKNWHKMTDLSKAGATGYAFERYGDNSTGTRVSNARSILGAYRQREAAQTRANIANLAKEAASLPKLPAAQNGGIQAPGVGGAPLLPNQVSNSATLNQKTEINIMGNADANQVAAAQNAVSQNGIRNMQTAIR